MELVGSKNQHLKFRQERPVPLAKEHPGLPDFFNITIELRNGEKRTLQAIRYGFIETSKCFEIQTAEDEFKLYPADVVCEITFDKDFSKVMRISQEIRQNALAKASAVAADKGGQDEKVDS